MLRELHISNLAVIADAKIELSAGLNCFTGATGAGKSLVIGALEILLGLRSAGEMLRAGADEGRVSGVFDIDSEPLLKAIATLADSPVDTDGGEILLTRRLFSSGRTSVSLNGHPITLAMLKQIAEQLVDVHGQHDHQFLLKPSNQLDVLDDYARVADLRQQYQDVWTKLQDAQRRLHELHANRTLRTQQLELYKFQADEIDTAELDPGEYEELTARSSVLSNLERLKKEVAGAYASLYEVDGSLVERLKMMAAVFIELQEVDSNLKPIAQVFRDATLQLEDAAFDVGRYLDKLDLDPGELAEVSERLNVLNRILNKYGDPVQSTLDYRAEIGQKIAELDRAAGDDSTLSAEIAPLKKRMLELGRELSKKRRAAAGELARSIDIQLAELGMERAKFTIELTTDESAPHARGIDQAEFVIQTNPGLPAQPLRKIASGGEMSRVMLAMKGTLAAGDRVSVLVFDEIDSNVGGRLGSVIGEKLRGLATHHQVLCITHLPQIASYGDNHLTVRKEASGKETRTTVRAIAGDERVREIAEMIGGQRITETTLAQARELLDSASGPVRKSTKSAPLSKTSPKRDKPAKRR